MTMAGMSHFSGSDPLEIRVLDALTSGAATAADVSLRTGQPVEVVAPILSQGVDDQTVTLLGRGKSPAYSLTPKGLHAVGVYQGVQGAVDGSGYVDLGAAARLVMEEYDAARDVAADDAVREQAGWAADDAARDRVTSALNDAYARGALTEEQLGERTTRALTASTMGELRAAADGVVELPPALPTGIGPVTGGIHVQRVEVSPALKKVVWRHVVYAVAYVLVGLFLMILSKVIGIVVVLAGIALGAYTLRPLWRSGTAPVRGD
jgi:hypothetical protein